MFNLFRDKLKHALLRHTANRFRIEDAIVVCGSPRSGTTWFAEVVAELPATAIVFEPLHLTSVPEAKAAGFNWRTFVEESANWASGQRFIEKALTGKQLNRWTLSQTNFTTFRSAKTLVVKFVRANRLLAWMTTKLPICRSVVIVRHPGSMVASRLGHMTWPVPKPPIVEGFIEAFPQYTDTISRLQHPEKFLAAQWAMDNLVPLRAAKQPWLTVSYEELVLDPAPLFRGVMKAWGTKVPAKFPANARVASSMTRRDDAPASDAKTLGKWKAKLTNEQIDRTFDVVRAFGFAPESDTDYVGENRTEAIRTLEKTES